jgi:hypothetical protein
MIGNWKWNFCIALASGLLTLGLSWPKNPALTTAIRSLTAFVIIFAAVYAVRWLWGIALRTDERTEEGTEAGRNVDLTTPADDKALLQEMLSNPTGGEPGADDFVPLQPEKLVSRDKLSPEQMTRAVRRMSED